MSRAARPDDVLQIQQGFPSGIVFDASDQIRVGIVGRIRCASQAQVV